MPSLYIFAMQCELKQDTPKDAVRTLEFMTRAHEYNFDLPKNGHVLFDNDYKREVTVGERLVVLESSWRFLLKNCHRNGEEDFPGIFDGNFQDYKLGFRRLVRDDDFFNVWYVFGPMIASLSETSGFVGYYIGDVLHPPSKLVLIYFENETVFECPIIPRNVQQNQDSILEYRENDILELDVDSLPDIVKQELVRQSNDANSTLEEYLLSVVCVKELVVPIKYQQEWKWR